MHISVEGIDSVIAALHERVSEERIAKGIAKGCKIVEGEAKTNCPVRTGELQRSITSQAEGMSGTVGTNKEYAGYVEFGTYKMAAQPYLVPALKSKESEVVEAVKAAIM